MRVEASFNHFGDRGRVDILAFHPSCRILLVVEIKSVIEDVQDTIGRLDIKVRVAPDLGRESGWQPLVVVPALLVTDGRTSQRRVSTHSALFQRFALRGRSALGWLRKPRGPAPSGLLAFIRAPSTRVVHTNRR